MTEKKANSNARHATKRLRHKMTSRDILQIYLAKVDRLIAAVEDIKRTRDEMFELAEKEHREQQ